MTTAHPTTERHDMSQHAAPSSSPSIPPAVYTAARYFALTMLWSFQYTLYVPVVLTGRLLGKVTKFAFTLGIFGVLLLFMPIIGWIILALILAVRQPRVVVTQQPQRRSIWTPWEIGRVA